MSPNICQQLQGSVAAAEAARDAERQQRAAAEVAAAKETEARAVIEKQLRKAQQHEEEAMTTINALRQRAEKAEEAFLCERRQCAEASAKHENEVRLHSITRHTSEAARGERDDALRHAHMQLENAKARCRVAEGTVSTLRSRAEEAEASLSAETRRRVAAEEAALGAAAAAAEAEQRAEVGRLQISERTEIAALHSELRMEHERVLTDQKMAHEELLRVHTVTEREKARKFEECAELAEARSRAHVAELKAAMAENEELAAAAAVAAAAAAGPPLLDTSEIAQLQQQLEVERQERLRAQESEQQALEALEKINDRVATIVQHVLPSASVVQRAVVVAQDLAITKERAACVHTAGTETADRLQLLQTEHQKLQQLLVAERQRTASYEAAAQEREEELEVVEEQLRTLQSAASEQRRSAMSSSSPLVEQQAAGVTLHEVKRLREALAAEEALRYQSEQREQEALAALERFAGLEAISEDESAFDGGDERAAIAQRLQAMGAKLGNEMLHPFGVEERSVAARHCPSGGDEAAAARVQDAVVRLHALENTVAALEATLREREEEESERVQHCLQKLETLGDKVVQMTIAARMQCYSTATKVAQPAVDEQMPVEQIWSPEPVSASQPPEQLNAPKGDVCGSVMGDEGLLATELRRVEHVEGMVARVGLLGEELVQMRASAAAILEIQRVDACSYDGPSQIRTFLRIVSLTILIFASRIQC
eukprot:SAG11_NODE_880_length_6754_cov_29.319760_5_plen_716_part_00